MSETKSKKTHYTVTFRDPKEGENISLKVNSISDSSLGLSFIALSDFIFHTDTLIANPTEEQMKKRYENTERLHLSIYSILSIEEVGEDIERLKFKNSKSNLLLMNNSPHVDQ